MAARRPLLAGILERGTWLKRSEVDSLLGLALPGVDELAGLLEIERLAAAGTYDHIVVDTAPTGHTLRLLATPETFAGLARVFDLMQEKHRVLATALGRGARRDASEALIDELRDEGVRLRALLRDPGRTRLCWVLLPETLSVAESARAIATLGENGIRVMDVLINRATAPPPSPCALCEGRRRAEADVLRRIRGDLRDPPSRIAVVPAREEPARGVEALRSLSRAIVPLEQWPAPTRRPAPARRRAARPTAAARALVSRASTRLLIVGGKGGVGKTTCAATLALAAARHDPNRRVLLLSTDPAHSIGDVLEQPIGDTPTRVRGAPQNLRAREIDAAAGWHERRERYRASVDRMVEAFNTDGRVDFTVDRAILEELFELAPPGMDEIAGMLTIVDALFAAGERVNLVLVDTAPTGHALRLLAMPQQARSWVRQFMKLLLAFEGMPGFADLASELLALSRGLDRLQRLLTTPRACGFVVVTRPERLPTAETIRLIDWLRRHAIAGRALVMNGLTPPGCSRCRRAAARERREMSALLTRAAWKPSEAPVIETEAIAPPPRGARALESWGATWWAAPRNHRRDTPRSREDFSRRAYRGL
jgi:arsenite-transporting ATPase